MAASPAIRGKDFHANANPANVVRHRLRSMLSPLGDGDCYVRPTIVALAGRWEWPDSQRQDAAGITRRLRLISRSWLLHGRLRLILLKNLATVGLNTFKLRIMRASQRIAIPIVV